MEKESAILKLYEDLKTQRTPYESIWDEINALIMPNRESFFTADPSTVTAPDLYDSTGVQSAEFLAATLLNGLVNQESKWFNVINGDKTFRDNEGFMRIQEDRAEVIYELYNKPQSGFYSAVSELTLDLVTYGTACLEIEYIVGEGLKFKSIHLAGIFIATDKAGNVDTLFRRFFFTARQAAQMWGIESLGPQMLIAIEEDPYKKFEIVRCVKPEESYVKKVRSKHKYLSTYISVVDKHTLSEGGLKYFPYVVPRWTKLTNQDYGRSPAWAVLSDLNMIQGMDMSSIGLAQMVADPMRLLANDGIMFPVVNEPGGDIYGGLSELSGKRNIDYLVNPGNLGWLENTLLRKQESVRKAFFNNTLNNQSLPQMTAEEVVRRTEEDLRTLAPNVNRFKMEALEPILDITYKILDDNNAFEDLPSDIRKALKGQEISIEFTGPLSRTYKLQESSSYVRWMNTIVAPLAQANQIDPEVKDVLNVEAILKENARNLGVPLSQINSPEIIEQLRSERKQQEDLAMEMQLAEQADKAEANAQAAQGTPPGGDI